MKKNNLLLVILFLFIGGSYASAQKERPISANRRPLSFSIIRSTVTKEPQLIEQVEMELTGVNLAAASGQRGYTYNGPINEKINYQVIPVLPSESLIIVEFRILNVRRKLDLTTNDVLLIDSTGYVHHTLGSSGHKENSWIPIDSEELSPKKSDNDSKWIFKVPSDVVSGAVIQFQNAKYPISITK